MTITIPDTGINPAVLLNQEDISAKTRLSIGEIGVFGINQTLVEYERDPDNTNILDILTSKILDLTRSRDSKKGTNMDMYVEAAKIKIMSIRNLPKDDDDEF